ncbi:MAG: hypothetical protein HYX38_03400 [Rhodospirillales bacterium]|nr:hypothetical protein [Rhodospirillales bacterium]
MYWTIDSRQSLVTITCEGDVTRSALVEYLDVVEGAGALSYRKLFDATDFQTSMTALDMLEIGARFRIYHTRPIGPLAIVLPPDKADLFARVLGILAAADRPMRVFDRLAPARRWIESLAAGVGK